MEIRQLKYFCAVAKELNIGRAASTLNMSQPPLTRQIQQLEAILKTQLFIRSARGVELTDAGHTLYSEAKHLLSLVDLASERTLLSAQGLIGRLDVGIFGSGMFDVVPRVLLQFRKAFPDVKIVLHTLDKSEQLEALRERRINVGFNRLVSKHSGIHSTIVTRERLIVAVHRSNPLASRGSLTLRDLVGQPMSSFPVWVAPTLPTSFLRNARSEDLRRRLSKWWVTRSPASRWCRPDSAHASRPSPCKSTRPPASSTCR